LPCCRLNERTVHSAVWHVLLILAGVLQQGMGYLHAKGIIHKDLKSKNVFLESGNQTAKVVITDFGLFNVTKLCQGSRSADYRF